MLYIQKLVPNAILPTIAHVGEDLAYDLYACETVELSLYNPIKVSTGIAAVYKRGLMKFGLLTRDRSSMAMKGAFVVAGVIDHGYHGEICVVMRYQSPITLPPFVINAGDKIAQMIPLPVFADEVQEVVSLDETFPSVRKAAGFGSTGS